MDMVRAVALLFAALASLFAAVPASAQSGARVVASASWIEEWDPVAGAWVQVADRSTGTQLAAYDSATTTISRANGVTVTETVISEPVRFIARPARLAAAGSGQAQFGPFRVLDNSRAALVGTTDAGSPAAFAAMLAAHPRLAVLEFVDAPGTNHDLANLKLGRAIRAAGLATHVPERGSARSGAVELFLAGTQRSIAPGALFAVHSWRDERGREPADFAPDAPENRLYLDYYAEMGMSEGQARAFYAMTNSVPHEGALWLEGAQMARWIATDAQRAPAVRSVDDAVALALRDALSRTGAALTQALTLRLPGGSLKGELARGGVQQSLADGTSKDARIAYALLDSGPAFP